MRLICGYLISHYNKRRKPVTAEFAAGGETDNVEVKKQSLKNITENAESCLQRVNMRELREYSQGFIAAQLHLCREDRRQVISGTC